MRIATRLALTTSLIAGAVVLTSVTNSLVDVYAATPVEALAVIGGTVIYDDGSSAIGSIVHAIRVSDGAEMGAGTVGSFSSYVITDLGPGDYRLEVSGLTARATSVRYVVPGSLLLSEATIRDITVPFAFGRFEDSAGRLLTEGSVITNCDNGVRRNSSFAPTFAYFGDVAGCTFQGSAGVDVDRPDGSSQVTSHQWLPSDLPVGSGALAWTIPTETVEVRVVDDADVDVAVDQIRVVGFEPTAGPGPSGTTVNYNQTFSQVSGNLTPGPYKFDVIPMNSVSVAVILADGTNIVRIVDLSTGPVELDINVDGLDLVRATVTDTAGTNFGAYVVNVQCFGTALVPIAFFAVDGRFATEARGSSCSFEPTLNRREPAFGGSLFRFLEFNPSPYPTTSGNYTWTVPTQPLDISVIDEVGAHVRISQLQVASEQTVSLPGPAGAPLSLQVQGATLTTPTPGTYRLPTVATTALDVRVWIDGGGYFTTTIDTTAGNTEVVLVLSDPPQWIKSGDANSLDSDGVDDIVESRAPNDGDGNNDGIKDYLQANVASLVTTTGDYVSVVGPAGSTFGAVAPVELATLPAPPADFTLPDGIVGFTISGIVAGSSVPITIFTPNTAGTSGYAKFLGGAWVTLPASNVVIGTNSVTITLTDGGLGDDDGVANGVIVDPGGIVAEPLYRAVEFDHDANPSTAPYLAIERNVRVGGLGDYDADGDGWAVVARSRNASESGAIASFVVRDLAGTPTPEVSIRTATLGCLTLTPRNLNKVRIGQTRTFARQIDTSNCRTAPPSDDTDNDGIADNAEPLYTVADTGTSIIVWRNVVAAEAILGVSDWDPDGDGRSRYSATTTASTYGRFVDITVGGGGVPTVRVRHVKKGCMLLMPKQTDTVKSGQNRRLTISQTLGGNCLL